MPKLDAFEALHRHRDIARGEQLQHAQHRGEPGHAADQHVLEDGEPPHEIVVLEDHPDGTAPLAAPGCTGVILLAVDHDAPGVGMNEAVDAAEHRRLAGAARAEHDENSPARTED